MKFKKPRLTETHVAKGVIAVRAMSIDDKIKLCDEIKEKHPALLYSVVVQSRFGTSPEDLEVLIDLLCMCYEAVRASGLRLRPISEDEQERCLTRVVARGRFMEGLSPALRDQAVQDQLEAHPEPVLLALVLGQIQSLGMAARAAKANKYYLISAVSLVECIADAFHNA